MTSTRKVEAYWTAQKGRRLFIALTEEDARRTLETLAVSLQDLSEYQSASHTMESIAMKSTPIAVFVLLVLLLGQFASGQALDDASILRASQETLLSMPEPPLGYAVSKHPITIDGQLVGFQVQAMKEDAVRKVLARIEYRDLSERGARVAACKGYVNGFVSGLKDSGFNLTGHKIPDIEKHDFTTPVVVDLTFANDEGVTVYAKKRMFFTSKGYDVTIIATDDTNLRLLSDWAEGIRPAVPASNQ